MMCVNPTLFLDCVSVLALVLPFKNRIKLQQSGSRWRWSQVRQIDNIVSKQEDFLYSAETQTCFNKLKFLMVVSLYQSWLIGEPGITSFIQHSQFMLKVAEEMVITPSLPLIPSFYSSYYSAVSALKTSAYFSPLRRNVFADIHSYAAKLDSHSFICSNQTHTRDRGTLLPINVTP